MPCPAPGEPYSSSCVNACDRCLGELQKWLDDRLSPMLGVPGDRPRASCLCLGYPPENRKATHGKRAFRPCSCWRCLPSFARNDLSARPPDYVLLYMLLLPRPRDNWPSPESCCRWSM